LETLKNDTTILQGLQGLHASGSVVHNVFDGGQEPLHDGGRFGVLAGHDRLDQGPRDGYFEESGRASEHGDAVMPGITALVTAASPCVFPRFVVMMKRGDGFRHELRFRIDVG